MWAASTHTSVGNNNMQRLYYTDEQTVRDLIHHKGALASRLSSRDQGVDNNTLCAVLYQHVPLSAEKKLIIIINYLLLFYFYALPANCNVRT
jgi:hypothetical protein